MAPPKKHGGRQSGIYRRVVSSHVISAPTNRGGVAACVLECGHAVIAPQLDATKAATKWCAFCTRTAEKRAAAQQREVRAVRRRAKSSPAKHANGKAGQLVTPDALRELVERMVMERLDQMTRPAAKGEGVQ